MHISFSLFLSLILVLNFVCKIDFSMNKTKSLTSIVTLSIVLLVLCIFTFFNMFRTEYCAKYLGPKKTLRLPVGRKNSSTKLSQGKVRRVPNKNNSISCIVLLNQSPGRLGNRLFLFASAYGIARTHGCHLYINSTYMAWLENIFYLNITFLLKKLDIEKLPSSKITSLYSDCKLHSLLMRPNAFTYLKMRGYWQAYGHFSQFENEIRYQLQFKRNAINVVTTFLRKILRNISIPTKNVMFIDLKNYINTNSLVTLIGVHIRRGDFLRPSKIQEGRTVSSNKFLLQAMEYFSKRFHNNVIFIVASDEKKLYRNLFRFQSNVYVTPDSYSAEEDLAILSLCHSNIITGGSFGWWAAFLANGFVIHDKEFPRKNSSLDRACPRMWYFPPRFLFL